ncbi:hypothetical protein CRG98_019927 [Punica granatum]|uniref:Thiaminase-2/PQQC domain-containing protein n=1 Tax=Punica granatum TaxID=22663 RepID=A0A2I0JW34_PUNGR|nr:hypothetical protein CRG98_019927 [Punica granatum]
MEYARDYAKDDDAINRLRMEVTKSTGFGFIEGLKDPDQNRLPTYTIGVIAAYLRLCASLGKEFKKVVEAIGIAETKHYKNWIKYYAAQNFEAAVEQTENLLDKLSAPLTGNDFEILENLYRRTLELGVEVLSAQAISQPCITPLMRPPNSSGRRLLFFSAFDSTCSVSDSSNDLAQFAIEFTRNHSFFEALAILDEELTTRVIASGLLRDLTVGQLPPAISSLPLLLSFIPLLQPKDRTRSFRKSPSGNRGMALDSSSDVSSTADSIFARQFWHEFSTKANFALLSPSALCYTAGNLEEDAFVHLVSQQIGLLRAFMEALSFAEKYADADDARNDISKLRMDVDKIIERGSNVAQHSAAAIDPAARKYTSFLHEAASGDIEGIYTLKVKARPAYILGVIVPSLRLSAILAQQFKKF